jgi:2'-5' RNA ligase
LNPFALRACGKGRDNEAMDAPAVPTMRLFLALWPPPPLRAALAAHADAWQWPAAARRTRTERLHATLHFLGSVPAQRLPVLQEGLRVDWPGCDLLLDQPQVWPGGIAVLEACVVPPALAALHATLGERLEALGVPVETRRYRPHVTFARKAAGARPPSTTGSLRWQLGPGYVLVQSLPGGRGYVPVQVFG